MTFPTFKKGQRVRIPSYKFGNLYATVVQDSQIANRLQLVHIDGTREVDHRWVEDKHLYPEDWEGQYAPERVADSRLTE